MRIIFTNATFFSTDFSCYKCKWSCPLKTARPLLRRGWSEPIVYMKHLVYNHIKSELWIPALCIENLDPKWPICSGYLSFSISASEHFIFCMSDVASDYHYRFALFLENFSPFTKCFVSHRIHVKNSFFLGRTYCTSQKVYILYQGQKGLQMRPCCKCHEFMGKTEGIQEKSVI